LETTLQPRHYSVETIPFLKDHAIDGTPFVPIALLAEELMTSGVPEYPDETYDTVALIEIEQPVMLRRNRPKDLKRVSDGSRVLLADAGNATYATGFRFHRVFCETPLWGNTFNPGTRSECIGDRPRESLYPDLFFHGQTFQADWKIASFQSDRIRLSVSGLSMEPSAPDWLDVSARRALIPADLGVQSAALFAMLLGGKPVTPWACDAYTRSRSIPRPCCLWIEVRAAAPGAFDIDIHLEGGSFIIGWRGLQFKPFQAPMLDSGAKILEKIRREFPL